MNKRMDLYILVRVMALEGALMIPSVVCGLIYRESEVKAFFIPILLCAAFLLLAPKKPKHQSIYSRDGFFIVAASWVMMSLIGSLPLYLCGRGLSIWDCIFEIVSGFTTTGSSVIANVEALPKCALFWRSFTHWVGGMGVLVFMLAVLPQAENRSLHLMRAEMPGPVVGKLVPKAKQTAKILYAVYSFLTVILIILLVIFGMPLFDAICTAFATAGTGGFAVRNAGINYYDSFAIEMILSVFMLLFGVNFNLYFFLILRKFRECAKDEELRVYLSIVAASTLMIMANVYHIYHSVGHSFRTAIFQVSSIMTTTGFATVDFYNEWPQFSNHIIVLLMIIGASAGSTGGGLKVSRLIILAKSVSSEIHHFVHPRSVNTIRLSKKPVDEETIKGTRIYIIAYMLIICVSTLLISINDFDFTTNLSSVLTCFNNIGPGLGLVGPAENFSFFSPFSKMLLALCMLLGRLEIFPMLIILSPQLWRRSVRIGAQPKGAK